MKILLFVVAVVLLLWLLRKGISRRQPPKGPRDPVAAPKPMLACAQCGVPLPRDEALPGRGGCSAAKPSRRVRADPPSAMSRPGPTDSRLLQA